MEREGSEGERERERGVGRRRGEGKRKGKRSHCTILLTEQIA